MQKTQRLNTTYKLKNTGCVLEELKTLAQEDYKAFNNKIIPTQQTTLGVRLPILRKIAKRIVQENPTSFIQLDKQNIYEMIMLEGMVLSYMDQPFNALLPLIEKFLAKADNWAQIDSTVCNFKNIAQEKEDVLIVVQKWLQSDQEFFVRAGLVILLAHYVEKDSLKMIFELCQKIQHTGYYVSMGNAWLLSTCMAKSPNESIIFFQNNELDNKTHNRALQKCCKSFRVSQKHKELLKELKRK